MMSFPRATRLGIAAAAALMTFGAGASLAPAAGCTLLKEVLLGTTHILRTPEPGVTIKDISAEMIDFELSYSVADVGAVDRAQNELGRRSGRPVRGL